MTDSKMGNCPECGGALEINVPEKCSLNGVDAYKGACYCSCGYKFEVFAETADECLRVKKHGKQLCFIERGGKRVWSSAS